MNTNKINYLKSSHLIIEKLDLKIPLFIAPMLGVTSEALIISASQEKTFSSYFMMQYSCTIGDNDNE